MEEIKEEEKEEEVDLEISDSVDSRDQRFNYKPQDLLEEERRNKQKNMLQIE